MNEEMNKEKSDAKNEENYEEIYEKQEKKRDKEIGTESKFPVKRLTKDDFSEFVEGGEHVLVDFWAPRCSSCRSQMAILDTMLRDRKLPDGTSVASVNVDEEPELAAEFGVMNIPTLMIFRKGNISRRYVGVMRSENIAAALEA